MEITRKSFFSGALIGFAGLTLLPADAFAALPDDLDAEEMALRDAVGETFYARGVGDVLVPLVLVRSVDVRSDALADQFSLYFASDERNSLVQGTWKLVSSRSRRAREVFLVPAGSNDKGDRLYRADFCILKETRQSSARR